MYHVNINDERRPSNEFIHEYTRHSSPSVNLIQVPVSRVHKRGRGRRGSTSQKSGVNSHGTIGSGSRGSRRKQYFETTLTDTMTGFREFQCQSLQQLHPNSFDQNDFEECETVVKIFEAMELPNDTKFYWECIRAFKEDEFWRKYFIARADKSFEDKIQFLQGLTGYTRDDKRVSKRLSSGHHFGSPSAGGFHYGSLSAGGNN